MEILTYVPLSYSTSKKQKDQVNKMEILTYMPLSYSTSKKQKDQDRQAHIEQKESCNNDLLYNINL